MKDGQKCCFDQTAGSKALYKASTGLVYDEDAIKKSKTNATVKALSLLGFAGDIHAGYWNAPGYQQRAYDHYYSNSQTVNSNQQAQQQQATVVKETKDVQQNVSESKPKRTENQLFNDAISAINKATDTSVLDAAYNRFKGTNFEKAIVAACKNKKTHERWGQA